MLQAEIAIVVDEPIEQMRDNSYSSVQNLYYRILLQTSFAYGVRAAIFCLYDCKKRDDGTLYGRGLFWSADGFVIAESIVPRILENRVILPYHILQQHYAAFCEWLEGCTILNGFTNYIDKLSLPKVLIASGLGAYSIPTYRVDSFEDIRRGMLCFQRCIVKPAKGNKGIGLSYIEKRDGVLYYSNAQSEGILTEEIWDRLCREAVFHKYILQPCLDFHNAQGLALDFRLLVSRGKDGAWEIAVIHARVGGSRFVANGSSGGAVTLAEEVLLREFGPAADRLMQELIFLGTAVPNALDRFNDRLVSCYGIDAAIDRETMLPYIIEVNLGPGVDYTPWHLAERRARYYRHLLHRPVEESGIYQPATGSLIYSTNHAKKEQQGVQAQNGSRSGNEE
ncbi:MAG: YheC/YheD family protein [Faecousia sp.]